MRLSLRRWCYSPGKCTDKVLQLKYIRAYDSPAVQEERRATREESELRQKEAEALGEYRLWLWLHRKREAMEELARQELQHQEVVVNAPTTGKAQLILRNRQWLRLSRQLFAQGPVSGATLKGVDKVMQAKHCLNLLKHKPIEHANTNSTRGIDTRHFRGTTLGLFNEGRGDFISRNAWAIMMLEEYGYKKKGLRRSEMLQRYVEALASGFCFRIVLSTKTEGETRAQRLLNAFPDSAVVPDPRKVVPPLDADVHSEVDFFADVYSKLNYGTQSELLEEVRQGMFAHYAFNECENDSFIRRKAWERGDIACQYVLAERQLYRNALCRRDAASMYFLGVPEIWFERQIATSEKDALDPNVSLIKEIRERANALAVHARAKRLQEYLQDIIPQLLIESERLETMFWRETRNENPPALESLEWRNKQRNMTGPYKDKTMETERCVRDQMRNKYSEQCAALLRWGFSSAGQAAAVETRYLEAYKSHIALAEREGMALAPGKAVEASATSVAASTGEEKEASSDDEEYLAACREYAARKKHVAAPRNNAPGAPPRAAAIVSYYEDQKPRAFHNALKQGKGGEGSCWLNAALQAMWAPLRVKACLRTLPSNEARTVQDRVAQTFRMCYEGEMTAALYPNLLADLFYRGQLEDVAEFLTRMLNTELHSLQDLFRTPMRAFLCCQRPGCEWRRHIDAEFQRPMSHHLSLRRSDGTDIRSVKEALSLYPRARKVDRKFRWECGGCGCPEPPIKKHVIEACPDVLLLFLDRWVDDVIEGIYGAERRRRNLLHPVEPTREIHFGGQPYDLSSVVIHAGSIPDKGHYMAVARHETANGNWWLYNDHLQRCATDEQINTFIWPGDSQDMKSYALFYSKR